MPNTANAPRFAPAAVAVDHRDDGSILLRSPAPLSPFARCGGDLLRHWAEFAPDRVFLAERAADGWRRVTYADALARVDAIGQSLVERGLDGARPVAILSGNAVDHGLLALGAMHAGIPVAPVSPAYSLMSADHGKLKAIAALLDPALVYVADTVPFAPALAALGDRRAEVVASANPRPGDTPFASLLTARPDTRLETAFASVRPETVAKILFTSGSTGMPKGVVNTQRMMCSNQQALLQIWPFLGDRPPVLVDWLPWNHTFGGNHNFNMVLRNGGTLWIDGGRPLPGQIGQTVANLGDVSPSIYFNVPRGYDMLIPELERDEALRATFFRRLDMLFYSGASLPETLWRRLDALSEAARGTRVPLVTGYGSTESSPMFSAVHFPMERLGSMGIPVPGIEMKLVPTAGKYEIRGRGAGITPGYFRRPDLAADAFDADGWYRFGDLCRFVDEADPAKGLMLDGRIAEEFKLSSGTWVAVGSLRVAAIDACAPVLQDAVIAGHDRDEVGLLGFASEAGCRRLCPDLPADAPLSAVIGHDAVRRRVAEGLGALAGSNSGSSTRITRALLMAEPPAIDANEITDKGYINQRAVLDSRAALVERLYRDDDAAVIRPG